MSHILHKYVGNAVTKFTSGDEQSICVGDSLRRIQRRWFALIRTGMYSRVPAVVKVPVPLPSRMVLLLGVAATISMLPIAIQVTYRSQSGIDGIPRAGCERTMSVSEQDIQT